MPELEPFITLEREDVLDCRVFRVERVRRKSQRTGLAHDYFHIAASDWVHIIALTKEGEVVLVRQERHGTEAFSLELPGGIIEPSESPADAALRELREETGFSGATAEQLGWVHPNPALQSNRCYTFLARDVELAGAQRLDPREEIDVVLMPYRELKERVRRREVTHSLVISGLYFYELAQDASPRPGSRPPA